MPELIISKPVEQDGLIKSSLMEEITSLKKKKKNKKHQNQNQTLKKTKKEKKVRTSKKSHKNQMDTVEKEVLKKEHDTNDGKLEAKEKPSLLSKKHQRQKESRNLKEKKKLKLPNAKNKNVQHKQCRNDLKNSNQVSSKGKKKTSFLSMEDGEAAILKYMRKQNRPYNHTQIFDNIHGVVKKSQVPVILNKLCEDGKLTLQQFKKSKIYFVNQETFPVFDQTQLNKMDAKILQLESELNVLTQEIDKEKLNIKHLTSQMSNDNLDRKIQELSRTLEEKTKDLKTFRGKNITLMNKDEVAALKHNFNMSFSEWKKRKKAANLMVTNMLGDSSTPISRAEFMDELGIETDIDAGQDIKKYEKLFGK